MNNIVRNAIRVLRGLFVFRVFIAAFAVLVFAVRWSAMPTSEPFKPASPIAALFLVPTTLTAIVVFIPGLEKKAGHLYLPIALALAILSFSLELGVAYLNPGARVRIALPSGHEISLFWASTEMILLVPVPCMLAGAVYGLKGALRAATMATAVHLVLGSAVSVAGGELHSFLGLLPLRLAVLYAFPVITGYLADTWRREHSALEEANRRLRGYAATVENLATSRERVRLARTIHDTLAHSLSALVVQLEAVDTLFGTDLIAARAQFDRVRQHARVGLDEARQAISDLRSSPVEELGLGPALEQLTAHFGRRSGLHTEWVLQGTPTPLLPAQANALYQIAEEALDNVERHAAAAHVTVRLSYTSGITLEVEDDGQGFDPATVDPRRYGLVGIRERASLVDGHVTVSTAPNQGTRLTVEIAELWER